MYYLDDEDCFEAVDDLLPAPDRVCDLVFIGGVECAHNLGALKRLRVSHVLNLCGSSPAFPAEFTYHCVNNLADAPLEDLLGVLPECVNFVEAALLYGTGVLVHCTAGVSRSCAVVAAYLMKARQVSVDVAVATVRRGRPCVQPNCGFMQQLGLWEKMGFSLTGSTRWHRQYRLRRTAVQYQKTRKLPEDIVHHVTADPLPFTQSPHFHCMCCKRILFTEDHTITHEKGVGRTGRAWCHKDTMCTGNYFIEPCAWMGDLTVEEGQLHCPQCGALLGTWTWLESKCSCTAVISPSFCITKDAVASKSPSDARV